MGGVLGFVQVVQSTVAIKETFGKFNAVLEPGCHFLRVKKLDVRCVSVSVIRATVPKLELDDAFVQKDDIAKAVEEELEKVFVHSLLF